MEQSWLFVAIKPKIKNPIPNPRDRDSGSGIPKKSNPEANSGMEDQKRPIFDFFDC